MKNTNNTNKRMPRENQTGPQNPKQAPKKSQKNVFFNNIFGSVLIFAFLVILYTFTIGSTKAVDTISLSDVANDISSGKVASIVVTGDNLDIQYVDKTEKQAKKETQDSLSQSLTNLGVVKEKISAVQITNKDDTGAAYWLGNILPFLLPILVVVFLVWYLSRQVRGTNAQALSFGQSRARMINPEDKGSRVTFKDVAGAKEAKEELAEIVDFLKNPQKFLDIGARIPKGILLMGAPGTGKTLLARAVAGEAGVAFFSISGSEFVEMFVGVGASRVRDLFQMAKHTAPAIIFIDEIDAVGRLRGSGYGGGNDEREQTLNQILVEMDGFEPNEKVIIMAATNRPDVLDPALLRPGRFDRRVSIDLPDRQDRLEILKVHTRNKPFAEDVNLDVIAERTPGFSGADLHSLTNEAAIIAARESRKTIGQYDLIRSIEKVMLGPERKSHLLSKREKELTAYHEAGHAIVASVLEHADPVHKVSIISRGRAAGYTLKLPLEDRKMQSKNEFKDDLAVALGGYVVEKNIFNDLTTGTSNDLQVSTALARDMVAKYGMSEKIGPVAFETFQGARLNPSVAFPERDYSEVVGATIDSEVSALMKEAYERAFKIIMTDHRKVLDVIAKALIEKETLERHDFEQILTANGIIVKKKKEFVAGEIA
jgi:cell division protease FtsH